MKLHRLGLINKSQKGFTLIEILIVTAIVGLIGVGATMAIFQTFAVNALSTAQMTAVKDVENAVHWIISDAQMAQAELASGDEGVSGALQTNDLILRWSNPWANTSDSVAYTIQNGRLKRTYSHTDKDGNTSMSEAVVAQHIDIASANSVFTNGVLTFDITAATGDFRPASENRSFQAVLRSTPRPPSS